MRPVTAGISITPAGEIRTDPAGIIPEPKANSIIRFTIRHGKKSYRYAALRTGNRWYTTGHTCPAKGWTWEALTHWINSHEIIEPIKLMREN